MKTALPPAKREAEWYLVDATDVSLGRLATAVVLALRAKYSPE